jgi:hypothetical protein
MLSHIAVKGSQDDQVLCCTEASKCNIQKKPISGLKYKQRSGSIFDGRDPRSISDQRLSVFQNIRVAQGLKTRWKPQSCRSSTTHPSGSTVNIYFGNLGFRSFSISNPIFLQSVFPKVKDQVPHILSDRSDHDSLQEFRLQEFQASLLTFLRTFFPKVADLCHASF